MDWNQIAALAREAFREGVNAWIGNALIAGGVVNGPVLELRPGSLRSTLSLETILLQAMTRDRVNAVIARTLAKTLGAAWQDWAAGFQLRAAAFPTLAAVPGPVAPPTMGIPVPLRQGSSTGETSLRSAMLSSRLKGALQRHAQSAPGNMEKAVDELAQWVDASFQDWKGLVALSSLAGQGSVPAYAPPYVPVGAVNQGTVTSGGAVFAGPRFGRIVTR